jgi:hypothetical protein
MSQAINSGLPYIKQMYSTMLENNIIMIYEGNFNQDVTKSVLSMTERNFQAEGIDVGVMKKIYNVMVEALQNICKHEFKDIENYEDNVSSVFMIGQTDTEYLIISGNALKNEVIPIITEKVEKINLLDQDGLKQLYKEARLASTISSVGGAGLGFIDMARKSGNPISYHFEPINKELSFFSLLVTISKNETN